MERQRGHEHHLKKILPDSPLGALESLVITNTQYYLMWGHHQGWVMAHQRWPLLLHHLERVCNHLSLLSVYWSTYWLCVWTKRDTGGRSVCQGEGRKLWYMAIKIKKPNTNTNKVHASICLYTCMHVSVSICLSSVCLPITICPSFAWVNRSIKASKSFNWPSFKLKSDFILILKFHVNMQRQISKIDFLKKNSYVCYFCDMRCGNFFVLGLLLWIFCIT